MQEEPEMEQTKADRARDAERQLEDSDMPVALRRTLVKKIESGDEEAVNEATFRKALDRAISPEKPDQGS